MRDKKSNGDYWMLLKARPVRHSLQNCDKQLVCKTPYCKIEEKRRKSFEKLWMDDSNHKTTKKLLNLLKWWKWLKWLKFEKNALHNCYTLITFF